MSTRPARRWVAATIVAAIMPLVACDDGRTADLDARTGRAEPADLDAGRRDVLERLQGALRRGDLTSAAGVGVSQGGAEVARMVRNADRLRLTGVSLRLLADSATALTQRQRQRWGDGASVADVQVTWRYGGIDRSSSSLTVPMVFGGDGSGVGLLTADLPQVERAPLWLTDVVHVRRTSRAVVVTTDQRSAREIVRRADRAARTVRASLPGWHGVLCVEVPRSQGAFKAVSGVPQQQAAAIAAVATTPDGSSIEGSPQHVYVNPRLFNPLEDEGRQIVLSHEATHVALGAAVVDLPLWLSEGVADHVALRRSSTPVRALGAQILKQTREGGAPRTLPGADEFDGTDRRIGAWYEAAWLAVRLIADTYGEPRLWRFYRRSVRHGGTEAAFRDVLGTSQAEFVRSWRQHLAELAG